MITKNVYLHNSGFLGFISRNKTLWLVLVLLIGFSLDQASKIWIQKNLAKSYKVEQRNSHIPGEINIKEVYYPTKIVTVIPQIFNLSYKENPAAAFSLTKSIPDWFRKPMLITIGLLASLFFILWYFFMKPIDGVLLFSFSFILSGAAGNLFDRLRLGYVIDFLDVHLEFLGFDYIHWPTFNVADVLIVIGASGVIYRTLRPCGGLKNDKESHANDNQDLPKD